MDDKELQSLLFSAIQHGNVSLLDDLLNNENSHAVIDLPGDRGQTILHAAVIENNLNCVRCLLEHGADPNVFDTVGARTPLHSAVDLGRKEIVKAFLEIGLVNLDLRDDRNLNCFEISQICDNQELTDLIKLHQLDTDKKRNEFYSVLNQACSSNDPNLVRKLLKEYEDSFTSQLPPRWHKHKDTKSLAQSHFKELINWSSSSWNDVTLLFKTASRGYTEVCRILIEFGATAKCNENTNYSPLYVAAYGGFTETVRLLLDSFPSLVQEVTIEKWTVLHACCLQGHSETAKLILEYSYPETLKRTYINRSGQYEYSFAFDLNAQDAAGQTVIYLAVSANNEKLLDILLQTKLPAKISNTSSQGNEPKKNPHEKDNVSGTTRSARVVAQSTAQDTARFHQNSQLDKIIRQLKKHDSKANESDVLTQQEDVKYLICPFEMDTYCDYNSKTALHLAVCQQYHSIATTLLVNGSNPNLPILSRESIKSDFASHSDVGLNWLRSSKSTCLREACRLNDHSMCDILIRYGARDNPDNLALQVAALNRNSQLISKFLSLKSNPDPEFRINKKCNIEFAYRFKQGQKLCKSPHSGTTTTFSSMFPSTPVMIDWQNLKCIHEIDCQWLIDASLMHNKRLKNVTNSLIAITRLDLSSNNLKSLHPVIFRLPSLREMNLSNNRLESLVNINQRTSFDGDTSISSRKLIESHKTAMKRSKSSNLPDMNLESANIIDLNEPQEWDLPYLETLDLHDNLIMYLPDCLFKLPKLTELDVSSNQIRQLPSSLWEAPSLKEFIASSNLLDDLPGLAHHNSINDFCDKDESRNVSASEKSIVVENFLLRSIEFDERSNGTTSLDSSLELESQISSRLLPLNHLTHWQKKIELVNVTNMRKTPDDMNSSKLGEDEGKSFSGITYLNLSYNSLSQIPSILTVLATDLNRLNLSHNRLESLGSIELYPPNLKSLDLSHNQISSWFEHSKVQPRLDHLRSINLAHNCLTEIELSPIQPKTPANSLRTSIQLNQLVYPNVTALDVSYNSIQTVPKQISRLKDLSVLNLNGNVGLTTLPPELGLVSKLWNLGISGCNLNEPLKSIVESKTYKTMDIIGYLRSILEEAKPYARMKLMLVGIQGIGKTSLLEQMRHEGSTGSRRRAPEHWTKRMGHASKSNMRNQRGLTLSTVGVDIHDWIYCKRTPRGQQSFGPVSFSTWDFGGQNEFYATHRYFLSKRSIYLVVWSLVDGLDGILGIQQWLVNIQSRASGSPVIIVGTHLDTIEGGEQSDQVQWLQEEVHRRFIDVSDHDQCGLPRVMYSIVVSTKTKQNIKNLCNKIYDTVFSLRCPGSSERLLEQKIPATYLYLEEIVSSIANERHMKKQEPILRYEEYRQVTSEQLKLKYNKFFRDLEPVYSREINYNSELQQASRFLHENGVLLHYEDASLRDLYFLDPQWLCDILSHVVTIREINPHVKNGLMQIDDLAYLFKSVNINLHGGIQTYIVNLLNKFEVALTWNTHYLLIPSLLPADPNSIMDEHVMPLKICPKTRGRSAVRRYDQNKLGLRSLSIEPKRGTKVVHAMNTTYSVELNFDPGSMMHRLVLLRYLPAGFIARLQSTILSDPTYDDICSSLFVNPLSVEDFGTDTLTSVGTSAGWTCWKSGIRLNLQKESTINSRSDRTESSRLLSIQEFNVVSKQPHLDGGFKVERVQTCKQVAPDNPDFEFVEISSSTWCDLDVTRYSNIICVSVPRIRLKIRQENNDKTSFVEADNQVVAKLLAISVDHIDNLLEDWYPSLGTRFAHTLGGNYLVTRLVPCSQCFASVGEIIDAKDADRGRVSRLDTSRRVTTGRANFTLSSANESQLRSTANQLDNLKISKDAHCFYVEHCILNTYNLVSRVTFSKTNLSQMQKKRKSRKLHCPRHGPIAVSTIAPDITFEDVPDAYKVTNEQIERSKLIGRGTFGFVFRGSIRSSHPYNQMSQGNQEVALKLLQPVEPGPEADNVDNVAYNSLKSNWIREPFQCACKSYCTARHEVNLLQNLYHPNIVLFIGLCVKPLAIVLELAPMGSLADIFKTYKRAGVRIDQYSAQKIMLQVSRALEFLHQQRVIYRDLKAENVLVWTFPSPFATKVSSASVEVKLADYGISRQALSTGIWKGFAGTINFLAPEILRHHGDEEYTEKVDCFSFGMLMYELMALRPPMKHTDGSRNHLFDCGRPALMSSDLIYPNYMLDLMSVCWSQEPHYRPTASQIVSIVSTPEFLHLLDLVSLDLDKCPEHGAALMYDQRMTLWLNCDKSLYVLNIINDRFASQHHMKPRNGDHFADESQTICPVNPRIWFGRSTFYTVPINFKFNFDQGDELVMSDKSTDEEDVPSTIIEFRYHDTEALIAKQMIHIQQVSKILILTESRRLVLCDTTTFVCSNLDDGNLRYNCIAVDLQEKQSHRQEFRVFCGQTNGISCLDIIGDVIRRQSIIPMMSKAPEYREDAADDCMDVSKIVASGGSVWTAAGCTLHSWSIEDKCVHRKLDCWKLAPCSESIESINIEMYYQEARSSKISSLVYLNEQLFVGTSHGCLLIIEANCLKPLAVFRPYEGPVVIIEPYLIGQKDTPNLLVTVGKKYRDLIGRYLDTIADGQDNFGCVAILWSAETYNL